MLRSVARAQVQKYADAVGSLRWDNTEIDFVMGERQMFWWRSLLDVNPEYTFQTSTPVTDANGQIPLTYTSGAGDNAITSYRILAVIRDGIPLQEANYSDLKTAAIYGADQRQYYPVGDKIQLLPKRTGDTVTVTWNSLPVSAAAGGSDGQNLFFPIGFESIWLMDTAAELLSKAASQADATSYYKSLVAEKKNDFFSALGRMGTNPPSWRYADDGLSWGSN